MIQIEITQSPDLNVISTFKYFQNQIYLGTSTGDLWIKDNELSASHVMLEVIGNELLIHPQRGIEFYLINGKRASVIRKLKPQDEVLIGKTTFKVISFDETVRKSKKDILNNKLSQFVETNSPRLPVVEELTKRMK